ncbi:MAG: DUF2851 family protein [Flavobacteriaceae bacterium]|nr:DUF2851 family protein [Flavobacteriaceae bacterium]
MQEDFLHYVWKFQKFSSHQLITQSGESIQVLSVGTHNFDAGPDFLVAKIKIDQQIWIGNIEIHLSSSDWYQHGHEKNSQYDNVILHVVWNHDSEVYRSNGDPVPVLVLKDRVNAHLLNNYNRLMKGKDRWIPCEPQFGSVDELPMQLWLDRLFFERLEAKARNIEEALEQSANHWEGVFFRMLSKNFGLKVNGASFLSMAQSLGYSVVRKCSDAPLTLEALFMGQLNMLEGEVYCAYYENLQDTYTYLKLKHDLDNTGIIAPMFFRLRPPNFPTIRISQLASLLSGRPHLFSNLMNSDSLEGIRDCFSVSATHYWDAHYNFGVPSASRKKSLSKRFIDLLIINTVIPMKYCYAKHHGKEVSEQLVNMATQIRAEDNAIVKRYRSLRKMEDSALQSQALLQLKSCYCDRYKCLHCEVGNTLLKKQ